MTASDFLTRKAAALRARAPRDAAALDALRAAALATPVPANFVDALERGTRVGLIAEFKRRSPSAGALTDEAPAAVFAAYAAGGACAGSVLTDAEHFSGSLDDLELAAPVLPALRKDFIVSEAGVLEARAAGASALLLIVALLTDHELRALLDACTAMSLAALVEVHDATELERADAAGARLIGVNNRDLRDLRTDLGTTERLAARAPAGTTLVSESGIRTRADVARMRDAGAAAVLVGESLLVLRGPARAALVGELASVPRPWADVRPAFRLKVCGLTDPADAALAAALGADALGVVLWQGSPRAVQASRAAAVLGAAPAGMARVGVFVDASIDDIAAAARVCALHYVQLAGDETPALARAVRERTGAGVIRTVHVEGRDSIERFRDYPADLFLLDAPRSAGPGGTGRRFDPAAATSLPWPRERVILAGGLRADNVVAALQATPASAVDVCSGVESSPGQKDPESLREFIDAVHAGDRSAAARGNATLLESRT